MEPAIKIEEDSTDFGEFAFLSEQHLMEDITDTIKKGSSNTSKRIHSRKRKLDIAELFQLSSGNTTTTTGSASQRNLLEKPFPINTINELNEFDSLLLGNPSFTEKCVSASSAKGESSNKAVVKHVVAMDKCLPFLCRHRCYTRSYGMRAIRWTMPHAICDCCWNMRSTMR